MSNKDVYEVYVAYSLSGKPLYVGQGLEGRHYLTSVQKFGEINNLQKMYLLLDYVVGG